MFLTIRVSKSYNFNIKEMDSNFALHQKKARRIKQEDEREGKKRGKELKKAHLKRAILS